MEYRVVYSVLDDGPAGGGAAALSVTLLVLAFVLYLARTQGGLSREGQRVSGRAVPQLLIVAIAVAGLVLAWIQYEVFLQQRRCKEWVRAGDYKTTVGTLADYRQGGRAEIFYFRVGDITFSSTKRTAGFHGSFTVPGVKASLLRDGLRVRIAHREGYILRIEIAAEPGAAPDNRESDDRAAAGERRS